MFDDSSSRIAQHLRVLAEREQPGSRLPSTRALAKQFGAGPVTVQRALATLVSDGIVETRSGEGTFVAARRLATRRDIGWQTAALGPERSGIPATGSTLRMVPHDTIAMHGGYPDQELLPQEPVAAAVRRVSRQAAAFTRPPVAGVPELRRWFVSELAEGGDRGWRDSDVVITSGGQAALAATMRAIAAPGEAIVMESPTYWGAIAAARQAGLVIVPVARTGGAPSAVDLDTAFATSGARVFYAQPNYANPTGEQWSAQQRAEVLDVVAAHRAFVVEDDWAHDFGVDTVPRTLVSADENGHVVYLRSLTKSMSSSIRVAAVMARGPVRQRIESALALSDLYVSPILQLAALDVVTRPAWRTSLQRLRRGLGARRDALLDALRAEPSLTATPPPGGLHLWVRLPDSIRVPDRGVGDVPTDPDVVAARALARGLSVVAGREWFPAEPTGPYVRLSYAAAGPDRYAEAVEILAGSC
ncbi:MULTISPECIES: aminotransferase-like domain-containing protein [Gordonia]|uniref:aminotransferase-like domain-containing protein n=1 Tax=Gordonia TaxID=2053 RepID=UPI0007E93F81|nr:MULTISPECIES: PLP-dependent aminotransferase family protein [Gordonia]MCM3897302.1 PLP-dependent aminotransferase family protein [Gordonia sputi]OBA62044.1 GntR family transcriptional regulator [Gordonia sp. 852002-10350_SCH5691597]